MNRNIRPDLMPGKMRFRPAFDIQAERRTGVFQKLCNRRFELVFWRGRAGKREFRFQPISKILKKGNVHRPDSPQPPCFYCNRRQGWPGYALPLAFLKPPFQRFHADARVSLVQL